MFSDLANNSNCRSIYSAVILVKILTVFKILARWQPRQMDLGPAAVTAADIAVFVHHHNIAVILSPQVVVELVAKVKVRRKEFTIQHEGPPASPSATAGL